MNKEVNSSKYYSLVSKDYRLISKKRERYLKKIDELIIEFVDFPVIEYLDIGAGDGYRTKIIAEGIKAQKITLIDNCTEMFDKSIFQKDVTFINQDIKTFSSQSNYDFVTCLWNVLGHVGNKSDRFQSLQVMHSLLKPNGILILDVNNRFNVSHYGKFNVFKNRLKTFLNFQGSGYFNVGEGDVETKVYIHRPYELNEIADKIGFKVVEEKYVNYESGLEVNEPSKGQLFYILKKK